MCTLPTNGSIGAMSAAYLKMVGQAKKFAPNRIDERFVISSGQIGAANGAVKQHITCNHKRVLVLHQTHLTRAMTRSKAYFEAMYPQKQFVFLKQFYFGFGQAGHANAPNSAILLSTELQFYIIRMQMRRQSPNAFYKSISQNVIDVRMRIHQ